MIGSWVIAAFISFFLWGIMVFLPKLAVGYISPPSAIIYEVFGGVTVAFGALVFLGFQPEFNIKGAALSYATGIVGFLGTLAYFYAVSKGPVTIVSAISALYPLISVAAGIVLLHETMSLRQVIGCLMALGSIILLAF